MSALTAALTAFAASDGDTNAQAALFIAGEAHGAAHLLKHLDTYMVDARGADLKVASEWKTRIEANPTDRITRVLADG